MDGMEHTCRPRDAFDGCDCEPADTPICETCLLQLEEGETRYCQNCDPTQRLKARTILPQDEEGFPLYELDEPKVCPCCAQEWQTVKGHPTFPDYLKIELTCPDCLHVLGVLEAK